MKEPQEPQEPLDPTLEEWVVEPMLPATDPRVATAEKLRRILGGGQPPDTIASLFVPEQVEAAVKTLETRVIAPHLIPKPGFIIEREMITGLGAFTEVTDEGIAGFMYGMLPANFDERPYGNSCDYVLQIEEIFDAPIGHTIGEDPLVAKHTIELIHGSSMIDPDHDGTYPYGVLACKVGQPPTDATDAPAVNTRYFDDISQLTDFVQAIVNGVVL